MTKTSENQKSTIGIRLKEARIMAGLSQNQVANMIDIPRPSVSEIESGNRQVSAVEISRLCDIYDVSVNWVLGNKKDSVDADDNPKLKLAARELSKLKDDDLDYLMQVIGMIKTS